MIRKYDKSDYDMLCDWWTAAGMTPPTRSMMPQDTSFICEVADKPIVSGCLYLMNCKDAAMVEHIIGNPEFKGHQRRFALQSLMKHLEFVAKQYGYKVLVIFAYQDKVKARYEEIGFINTLNNVSTYAKLI